MRRLGKLLEILLVGIGGPLTVPLVLAACGLSGSEVLESASYLAVFMIVEASFTLLLVWGILRLNEESLTGLGWNPARMKTETLVGIASVPLLFAATLLVNWSFALFLPAYVTEVNPLLDLVKTRFELSLFLLSSVYVGGFKEEIQRAFILNRFGSHLGGTRVGLVLWSAFFAYGHTMQGIDNAVGAGVLGLIFGLIYLWRRSLFAPIVAHALFDITTLLVYWAFLRT